MKSKPKIAVFAETFPTISETFVINSILGLVENGCDVSVFSFSASPDGKKHATFARNGLASITKYIPPVPENKYSRLSWLAGRSLRVFREDVSKRVSLLNIRRYGRDALSLKPLAIADLLLNEGCDFDFVFCQFGGAGVLAAALKEANILRCPIVVQMHAVDIVNPPLYRRKYSYQQMFRYCDRILTVSDYMRQRVIELGCNEAKVFVQRVGVRLSELPPLPQRTTGSDELCVLTVGRLVQKKGTKYFLRAAQLAIERRPQVNWKFLIVGEGPDRPALLTETESLGLTGKVQFLGPLPQQDTLSLMAQADVFVLPSITADNGDQEGTPVAIMEAMALGVPVISTRHSGIPEMIDHDRSGLLVPESDAAAIANALCHLQTDQSCYMRVKEGARLTVGEKFDQHKLDYQFCEQHMWPLVQGRQVHGQ